MSLPKMAPYITEVCEYLTTKYPGEFEQYTKQPFVSQHHLKQVIDLLLVDKNPYPLFVYELDDDKPWQICIKDLPYIEVSVNYIADLPLDEKFGEKMSHLFREKEWQAYVLWIAYLKSQQAPSVAQDIVTKFKEEMTKHSTDWDELERLHDKLKTAEANVEIANKLKIEPIDFSSCMEKFNKMRQTVITE